MKKEPTDSTLPLAVVEPQQKMAVDRPRSQMPSINIEALIDKAVDSKAAVEVVKELRAMLREDQAIAAKQAFDEAMSLFQTKCPVISKSKPVQDNSGKRLYAYAPIERIEEIIRPVEAECGFTHTFDQDVASREGWVIVKCKITHNLGHFIEKTAMFPLGTKTQIMSNTQQYAAALTFANRRVLGNAYGLVFAGEDNDGGNKQKPAGPSTMRPETEDLKPLARELWNVLVSVRGDKQNWDQANQWLWREEILDAAADEKAPHLSAAKFREVIAKAKAKLGT